MNTNFEKKIYIVFEKSREEDGKAAVKWLVDSDTAKEEGSPVILDSGFSIYSFSSLRSIYKDSAIIFLSDEAVENPDWKEYIRTVSQDIRLIPIGRTNRDKIKDVPSCIRELNYIRLNDNRYDNLLDALTTDSKFYLMKNYLNSRSISWEMTQNDEYLLAKKSEIKRYKKEVENKRKNKNDPFLKEQLDRISEYLDISDVYASEILRKTIFRWVKRGGLFIFAIVMLGAYFKIKAHLKRATYSNIVIGVSVENGEPMVNAIKLVEAITNPYSSESAKRTAHGMLVECLDLVWSQNIIGGFYKYGIKDIAIPAGSRYLWTVSTGGKALLWDTYHGTITESYDLTDCSLLKISISKAGNTLAALDERGVLYVRNSSDWVQMAEISLDPAESEIQLTDERLVVYSENGIALFDLLTNEKFSLDCGHVIKAEIQTDGDVLIFCREESERVTSFIWDGRIKKEESVYDIYLSQQSVSDLKNGMLVVTDKTGQVWSVNKDTSKRIPLVLKLPIGIAIVNDDTLAYHERNMGSGMYCISGMFDYGNVLSQFKGVLKLETTEEMLVFKINSYYVSVSLSDILPLDTMPARCEVEYSSKEASVSYEGNGIQSIRIKQNGLVEMYLRRNGNTNRVVMDPALVVQNASGYHSDVDLGELGGDYLVYNNLRVPFDGLPVITGIRFAPANDLVNVDYYYVLLASNDGSFAEIALDPQSGDSVLVSNHKIPSRSEIKVVYQMDDGYLLEDAEGRLWKAGTGINLISPSGICSKVKAKMKSDVTLSLKELVSSNVWNELELEVCPGGDGKEWE